MARTKHYTAIGIKRVPCARCGKPSAAEWQICSDGNQYRGICKKCDISLNRLVLKFMKFENWQEMADAYANKIRYGA